MRVAAAAAPVELAGVRVLVLMGDAAAAATVRAAMEAVALAATILEAVRV